MTMLFDPNLDPSPQLADHARKQSMIDERHHAVSIGQIHQDTASTGCFIERSMMRYPVAQVSHWMGIS